MKKSTILDACKSCNGACCKIFCFNTSPRDHFLALFKKGKAAKFKMSLRECLKTIFWLKEITKQVKKHKDYCNSNNYFYTCKKFKNEKCTVYNSRFHFCHTYHCHYVEQIAHVVSIDHNSPLDVKNKMPREEEEFLTQKVYATEVIEYADKLKDVR